MATVSDTYGALGIPLVQPTGDPGEVVGDPCLSVLLEAFAAVLNAHLVDAWNTVGQAPTLPPVKATFAHDPNKVVFNAERLPALFLWRDGSATEYYDQTADRRLSTDTLRLVWVFPEAPQGKQRKRVPIERAVVAVIDGFLKRNRDPNWIKSGEASSVALRIGSNLTLAAGFFSLKTSRVSMQPVVIDMTDGADRRTYAAVQLDLTIEEAHTVGGQDVLTKANVTVNNGDTDPDTVTYVVADFTV